MSYFDLLLFGVVAWHIYVAATEGWRRTFFAVCRDVVALSLAMLLQAPVAVEVSKLPWAGDIPASLNLHVALPAGAGLTTSGIWQWLEEAQLPQAIAQSIASAWQQDSRQAVADLLNSASIVLVEALVNLACLIALFVGMRWLINSVSKVVVWALPKENLGESLALKVGLGIIQSMLVCILVAAVIAPLLYTTLLPQDIIEELWHSRMLAFFNIFLHYVNFYGSL